MNKINIKNNEELEENVIEAFDMLRNNIEFADANARVIVMTSACTKEGKSLIAFQLANNMAGNGKRVLLIMADYRKNVTGKSKDVAGMSEAIRGIAGLNDTVFKTDVGNLYLMFSGESTGKDEELIRSDAFDRMLSVMKRKFDYIIFDTAPVLDGPITSLLCSKCDGTVLIMEQEKTGYDVAFRAKEQIELSGSRILGVVLNNPI